MIKRAALALTATLTLALTACSDAKDSDAQTANPPAKTAGHSLTVQTINGSGCPATTATTATGDADVVASYTVFQVTSGRKNCQINVLVSPGDGNQAAVTTAEHGGTATLPAGSKSRVTTTYYVTAGSDLGKTQSDATAPAWFVSQQAPATVVTECGKDVALNINTEVAVAGSGATVTAELTGVHVDWRSC